MRAHHPPPHGFDKFLASARDMHGERFQYDRTSWSNADEHVRIQCSAHGWFKQIARNHIRVNGEKFGGCWECREQDAWQSFIAMAHRIHGQQFTYYRKSWRGTKSKMLIGCPRHGQFEQIPRDHLRMAGCRHCSAIKRGNDISLDEAELIKRFRQVHGDRYGYDQLNYTVARGKVDISCGEHGNFSQLVWSHQRGDECPRCSGRHRWSTREFIENSRRIHGKKFTYRRTKYIGSLSDVTITCKIHGDFVTQASRHITKKHGCAQCSPTSRKSLEHFLSKARERFGDRYDYSLVEYVNGQTPVRIGCRSHGIFEQPPKWHLKNAVGCQECSYNVSRKETAWLDSLNLPATTKRQAKVRLGGRMRNVDALNPISGDVYEFWGSWWHGDPRLFAAEDIHPKVKKTYGELYAETQHKRKLIKAAGYKLVEIWEHEYDTMGQQPPKAKKL